MPFTCVVPGCQGNYRSGPKVRVFSFPKDPELANKWIRAIKRDNFTPTKNSKVCELHFKLTDIRKESVAFDEKTGKTIRVELKVPRLEEGAIPSQLPNCPAYLSGPTFSRESPDSRRSRHEGTAVAIALAESLKTNEEYVRAKKIESLRELKEKFSDVSSGKWTMVDGDSCMAICHIIFTPAPTVEYSLLFDSELSVTVYVRGIAISSVGQYKFPLQVKDMNVVHELLHCVSSVVSDGVGPKDDAKEKLKLALTVIKSVLSDELLHHFPSLEFMMDQIRLLSLKRLVYTPETMVFSSLLFSLSPCGYRFLRESRLLTLPNESTLRRVTSLQSLSPAAEQSGSNFLSYIKQKCKYLKQNDLTVCLAVDEIHLKPFFDYKGGNIVGCAFDSQEAATSAYVFMISSIRSKFKDVVHIMPTKAMKAEKLCEFVIKIVLGLENIGFKVICIITDNNAINKKAISLLTAPPKLSIVYPHPRDASRPLFFLFDSVHLLKCVRNNWLAQRDSEKNMIYPFFPFDDSENWSADQKSLASFCTLRKLHGLESEQLLKYSYNLTMKALYPTNFEKQNVKLVLQIFNEYVVQGLLSIGKDKNLPFCEGTANYIKVFNAWWSIMNVKTPFKGQRLNDIFMKPLTKDFNDDKLIFLNKFLEWMDSWEGMETPGDKLSKETHCAIRHTTHGMIELMRYCVDELNMSFILPGKFQTDCLESRFGKYRQLSGSHYNISMRQVFESEQKLRLMKMLEIALPFGNKMLTLKNFTENWDVVTDESDTLSLGFDVEVTEEDICQCIEYLPVITYLAGYCCYAVNKRMKCDLCKETLIDADNEFGTLPDYGYIKGLDRGGLLYPNCTVVNVVMFCYIVVNKLSRDPTFISSSRQRDIVVEVTYRTMVEVDLCFVSGCCESGHSSEKLLKIVIMASANTLLNNFCSKQNDNICFGKLDKGKKRKFQTLL